MKISLDQAKEFNRVHFPIVKATVGCILIKENKVLLTKRNPEIFEGNKWCIPGGHIDIGETPDEAVIREVKEETGLNVNKLKFLFYFTEFLPELKVHNLAIIFTGEPEGKLKENEEVTEFGWFSIEKAIKLDLAFKHKEILTKYFKIKK